MNSFYHSIRVAARSVIIIASYPSRNRPGSKRRSGLAPVEPRWICGRRPGLPPDGPPGAGHPASRLRRGQARGVRGGPATVDTSAVTPVTRSARTVCSSSTTAPRLQGRRPADAAAHRRRAARRPGRDDRRRHPETPARRLDDFWRAFRTPASSSRARSPTSVPPDDRPATTWPSVPSAATLTTPKARSVAIAADGPQRLAEAGVASQRPTPST